MAAKDPTQLLFNFNARDGKGRFAQGSKGHLTHGLRHTPTYESWASMKYRCRYPRGKSACYVGISVCERWIKFENFLADMGEKPTRKHTIERKDSRADYTPENCVWAVMKVQANNKSNNRLLEYKGETHTIAQWAEKIGMDYFLLYHRVFRFHWSAQRALEQPVRKLSKG